ncbi:hypothetical protein K503DRAFT_803104 [Rhizopogon vinicolor AM-OR11-026]|uniref:Uncharacterized protein n=1 Tax=Rhizopogon vinicolor AM-OR11-026 TaxID=1314800 RepID=A0A1B7MR63_9AGAM|nr:hypothetical protein K503DRAFT_803104 [Rhizopogon vinicolor AM-OR11-026]
MDIQDIITWGEPQTDRFRDDLHWIRYLCAWGKEFGIDDFDGMELVRILLALRCSSDWRRSSEAMLCDPTAGVEVVSFLNVTTPKTDAHPVFFFTCVNMTDAISFAEIRFFEAMHSGSWRNHYPGDSRIVLDLPGLISFYDTALAPSLIPVRADPERCDHRVLGISSEDISRVMKRLTGIVSRPDPVGSGIDWKTLIYAIVDRYADRFESPQLYLIRLSRTHSFNERGWRRHNFVLWLRHIKRFGRRCLAVGIPDLQTMCHNTYFRDDNPNTLNDVFGTLAAESRSGNN